ncbi:MAG: tRNA dimethylallyltransferase [Acidimicrobiia bacterium]
MQVYRGLDIGTAKPTVSERARVPHHLVDVADPDEAWSVARFQSEARAAVADIESRGRRALLVGGTGLYLRAVVDDLRFPGEDRAVRARLEARASEPGGLAALTAELAARDPLAASRIDPANLRRTVRALEVMEITGEPFSASGAGLEHHGEPVFPVRLLGMWLPSEVLDARIVERVERMYTGGLIDEVRGLNGGARPRLSPTASQAIGYREAAAVVDGSQPSVELARETTVLRTRQFARRQIRWFRRDPRITWFATASNPDALVPAVLECCRG